MSEHHRKGDFAITEVRYARVFSCKYNKPPCLFHQNKKLSIPLIHSFRQCFSLNPHEANSPQLWHPWFSFLILSTADMNFLLEHQTNPIRQVQHFIYCFKRVWYFIYIKKVSKGFLQILSTDYKVIKNKTYWIAIRSQMQSSRRIRGLSKTAGIYTRYILVVKKLNKFKW